MKSTINLISEILEGERFPTEKLLLPAALFLPVLVLLMAFAWQIFNVRVTTRQLKQITERRDALTTEVTRLTQEIMSFERQGTDEQQDGVKKAMAVKDVLNGRVLWSDVFREVSFVVPPGVWLTSIETGEPGSSVGSGGASGMQAKQVKFIGFAKSNAAMTQFIAALERSEHFTEIALVYAQRGTEADSQQVNFEMAANLRTARL